MPGLKHRWQQGVVTGHRDVKGVTRKSGDIQDLSEFNTNVTLQSGVGRSPWAGTAARSFQTCSSTISENTGGSVRKKNRSRLIGTRPAVDIDQ